MKTKKLLPLFLNESLRGVTTSWLALFSSLFIYQRVSEVASPRLALAFVFISVSIFGLGKVLGSCLAEELSLKRGLKLQLVLGSAFAGLTFIFFLFSGRSIFFLIPAKFFWGFSAGAYWFGWHGLVGKLGVLGEYGRAFGTSSLVRGIADFLAPVVGGVIIGFGGYESLFLAALGLVVLALLSLLFLEGEKTHQDTTLKEVFGLFSTHKKSFLAYSSLGALGTITTTAFILYLALILKKELVIGEFFSLSILLVAVAKFFIGKLLDWQKRGLTVLGSVARSLVWLGRVLTQNVALLLGLNVVNNLAAGVVGMSLGILTLEKAVDGRSTGRAVLFREIAISLGDLVAGLVFGVLALLGAPLTFSFVVAVFLSLTPVLVRLKGR